MKSAPKDVDAYIERAPKEAQGKLQKLRATIKEMAPVAEERISYGMPYYIQLQRTVDLLRSGKSSHRTLYSFSDPGGIQEGTRRV